MSTVAPEQTGFELDRFQWSGDDRLEVEGRWFGVRGRRFVRPVLTVRIGGGRRRLLALLEHKPWNADEGATWIAAFPWDGPHDDVGEGELEVGALTVDLPPPGGKRTRERHKAEHPAPIHNPGSKASMAERAEKAEAAKAAPKVVAPPEPTGEPVLRAAGESRQQLERDLATARAELGRLRARHEEELREAKAEARAATERAESLESRADESGTRADQLADEASRLREELERVRENQGDQITRMGASEAEARAEAARERERAGEAAGEAERLRAMAAETDRLQDERDGTVLALEELREKHEEALAEIAKLRQSARRSAAEAERLRAASRRPGARLPEPAPQRPADPQATVPFQALTDGEQAPPEPRPKPPAPSKPGPAVRLIPREKPVPAPEPEAEAAPEAAPEAETAPEPEVPAADETAATVQAEATVPTAPAAPARLPAHARPQPPRSIRPEPGAGAARLMGEDAIVPLEHRGTLEVWGPRLVAVVLVALLLIALALIVRGLI